MRSITDYFICKDGAVKITVYRDSETQNSTKEAVPIEEAGQLYPTPGRFKEWQSRTVKQVMDSLNAVDVTNRTENSNDNT